MLKVLPKVDELERICAEIEAMGEREDWPPSLVYLANFVLEELSMNIITHGNDGRIAEFEISLDSKLDCLTIEVIDNGLPFDPVEYIPDPRIDAPLEDRQVGGLGLHLIRSMVDELSYKREQGKNHLSLVARRDK